MLSTALQPMLASWPRFPVLKKSCSFVIFGWLYNMDDLRFGCRHSLRHIKPGSCIINTTSVNAYDGNPTVLDYTATKGAIVSFTRGLALQLIERGIRVNAVAPGPVWTPFQPASMPEDKVAKLGSETPMNRAAQPHEIAPAYVFLACNHCSSYFTGQVLHPNGN